MQGLGILYTVCICVWSEKLGNGSGVRFGFQKNQEVLLPMIEGWALE